MGFHLGRPPWPKSLLFREDTSAFADQHPIKPIQENGIPTETAVGESPVWEILF